MEWPDAIRDGVRAEKVELNVSALALRTVAGPESIRRSAPEATTPEDGLVLDSRLLSVALEQGAREPGQSDERDCGSVGSYGWADNCA